MLALIASFSLAPAMYATVVGGSEFRSKEDFREILDPDLLVVRGAANDAKNFARELVLTPNMKVSSGAPVTGKEVTANRIRDLLKASLEKTQQNGQAIFYFSGIGGCDKEGNPTLLMYDSRKADSSSDLPLSEIEQWTHDVKSKGATPVVLLDTCFPAENRDILPNAVPAIDLERPRRFTRKGGRSVRVPIFQGTGVRLLASGGTGRAYAWRWDQSEWFGAFTDMLRGSLKTGDTYSKWFTRAFQDFVAYRGPHLLAGFEPFPLIPGKDDETFYGADALGLTSNSRPRSPDEILRLRLKAHVYLRGDVPPAADVNALLPGMTAVGLEFDHKSPPDFVIDVEKTTDGYLGSFLRSESQKDDDSKLISEPAGVLGVGVAWQSSGADFPGVFMSGKESLSLGELLVMCGLEVRLGRAVRLLNPTYSPEFSAAITTSDGRSIYEATAPEDGVMIVITQDQQDGTSRIGMPGPLQKTASWIVKKGTTFRTEVKRTSNILHPLSMWVTTIFVPHAGNTALPSITPRSRTFFRERSVFVKSVLEGMSSGNLKWTASSSMITFP